MTCFEKSPHLEWLCVLEKQAGCLRKMVENMKMCLYKNYRSFILILQLADMTEINNVKKAMTTVPKIKTDVHYKH